MKRYIELTPENMAFTENERPLEKDRQTRANRLQQSTENMKKRLRAVNRLAKETASIPIGRRSKETMKEKRDKTAKRAMQFK